VDGVASRAKMNQQRSWRFRLAKESEVTVSEILARSALKRAQELPPRTCSRPGSTTPGTDFMPRDAEVSRVQGEPEHYLRDRNSRATLTRTPRSRAIRKSSKQLTVSKASGCAESMRRICSH
jgi:hypothetical protein